MGASAAITMGASAVGSSIGGFIGANSQAEALKLQGQYQKQMFAINTKFAEAQGKDAIRRGDIDALSVRKETKQIIGKQRAALAAQGIEVDSGSALDIQADTAMLGELDALTIKNNASREAFGYKIDALSSSMQGNFAMNSANSSARNTLTTGGLNAANGILQGGSYLSKAWSSSSSGTTVLKMDPVTIGSR